MTEKEKHTSNTTEEEKPTRSFMEIILAGFLLHAILPLIISGILYFAIHAPSLLGFALCIATLAAFIGATYVFGYVILVVLVARFVIGRLRLLFRKGTLSEEKDPNEPKDSEDKHERLVKRYFLPIHLLCSLAVFSLGAWLTGRDDLQIGIFMVAALLYSLAMYWGEKNRYLDYWGREGEHP